MTTITLHPSPLDRLDPVAAAIRWWTSQMLDMLGGPHRRTFTLADLEATKSLPRAIDITLPETDGFIAEVRLPKGHADAHRQALGLKLGDIAPIPPADLIIAARATSRGESDAATYGVAMARARRLAELEAAARKKGARSVRFFIGEERDIPLLSPVAERARRRGLVIDAGIVLAVAAAAVAASLSWTARIGAETEALAARERDIRGAAIAAETARDQAAIAQALVERGILDRRSTTALDHLAQLNAATPVSAWWTKVVWTPNETTITAQGNDPTAAIWAISSTAKAWSIALVGEIAASGSGGPQAFELIARPRSASPP